MKNKGKTNTLKKTKAVRLFLWALFAAIFLWVPNYKPFSHPKFNTCGVTESDAKEIAAAIAAYFADPEHTTLPTISGESEYLGLALSDRVGQNIAWVTGDPLSTITIVVQDGGGKCPDDYQERFPEWDSDRYTLILDW